MNWNRTWVIGLLLFVSSGLIAAGPLSEKWEKRLAAIEDTYVKTLYKTEQSRATALQKARSTRARAYRTAASDGANRLNVDVETQKTLNQRAENAEKEATIRSMPEKKIEFEGHRYALIKDSTTWHIAKRRCEEIGGHLATLNTPGEQEFIVNLCRKENSPAWIGATDEEEEGNWKWIDGSDVQIRTPYMGDTTGVEHYLLFDITVNDFNDFLSGRTHYMCEWDEK